MLPRSAWGVRHWCRQLAEASRRERVTALTTALDQLGERTTTPRQRLAVLHHLHPPVQVLLDELDQRISGQPLPLGQRGRAELEYYLGLLERLARGYQAVVDGESERKRCSKRRLARAGLMVLALRSRQLLVCAKVYRFPPIAFWRQVHAAYATLESAGVAGRRVRPLVAARQAQRSAPSTEYQRLLVFVTAQVESLPRDQLVAVFDTLPRWLTGTRLSMQPPESGQPMLRVNLASPGSPRLVLSAPGAPDATERFVNLGPLLESLEHTRATAAQEQSASAAHKTVSQRTLRHLLARFRGERSRSSKRQPAPTAQVRVTVGLKAIQRRLREAEQAAANNDSDGHSARRAPGAETAGLYLQTIEDHDDRLAGSGYITHPGHGRGDRQAGVWDAIQHGRPVSDDDTELAAARAGEDSGQWSLVDVSSNGVCLERTGDEAAAASVGQLVLLSRTPEGSARRCYLGIIRRMRSVARDRFQIGAEVFAQQPRPAEVRRLPANPNRKRNREQTPAEAGLFLPRLRNASQRAALLLPAYMFTQGEQLELTIGEQTRRIMLEDLGECTTSFTEFALRALGEQPARGPARKGRGASQTGLDESDNRRV